MIELVELELSNVYLVPHFFSISYIYLVGFPNY